jgi:diaminopimelate epimerase
MLLSRPIPFWKMSGSGNDFIVIDNRATVLLPTEAPTFTRAVCRHRLSVGADGVVLIEATRETGVDFRWRYINADGNDGEMCGNGAMCGARFAHLQGIAPATCTFRTDGGLVRAEVAANPASPRVKIAIADPGAIRRDIVVTAEAQVVTLDAIPVGVPHAVTFVADADAWAPGTELNRIGRAIRVHDAFAPAGTNVNVISIPHPGRIRVRTYERGVENETLACGTGAVASAVTATARGLARPPVEVITSSGRVLRVDFSWDGERATGVTLEGEARIIARGTIDPEALD